MTIPSRCTAALLLMSTLFACSPARQLPVASTSAATKTEARTADFGPLENRRGARIGVYAVDTGSGREIAHRADERFAYASTFKALLVGAVLLRDVNLDEVIRYSGADLVAHAPITGERTELTVRELCDAAVRYSDNTAANLLLRELGGPAGFADAMREIGDTTLHADRFETDLNTAVPHDIRDTSTPKALATSLEALTTGDALPEDERAFLVDLLRRNTTGDALIRAATPDGWIVGDKTGTAAYGTRNDIAVIWPPDRAPIVIAVLTTHPDPDAEPDDALVAEAARIALDALV
ncbi:class A beta-lactamase [Actinokineospora soli]